jgi:hypothetical protein
MGYYDYETEETPEQRRMRLLAEMGSPFLGNRPDADLGTVDSSGAFGFMPQGFTPQPTSISGLGAPPYLDPGQTPNGSGTPYVDPPPRLGNLFSKPQEPAAPEQDGILYNGTRSPTGRGVLAQATPSAAIPSGPIASPDDVNVRGANGQDRSNAPRSPDAPQTAAPISLPSMAGGLGGGAAATYSSTPPRVGAGIASPAPTGDAAGKAAPTSAAASPGQTLPQPQVAAAADGLSRKPGSPAAMTWLQDNADLFIALGAGLLSGKNIGEGIIQGLRLANETESARAAKLKLEAEKNHGREPEEGRELLPRFFRGRSACRPEQSLLANALIDADLVKRAQQIVFPDPSSPDWVREKDANGTDVLRNTKTGDIKAAPKAEKEEKTGAAVDAGGKGPLGHPGR